MKVIKTIISWFFLIVVAATLGELTHEFFNTQEIPYWQGLSVSVVLGWILGNNWDKLVRVVS